MNLRILIYFSTLALAGCDLCSCDLVEGVPSPDGRKWAVTYDCGCGATTELIRRVAIRDNGDVPKEPRDDDGVVCMLEQWTTVSATWSSAEDLNLQTDLDALIRDNKLEKMDSVTVHYSDISP